MKYWGCVLTLTLLLAVNSFALAPDLTAQDERLPLRVSERELTSNGLRLSIEVEQPAWQTAGSEDAPVTLANYELGGLLEVDGFPVVPVVGRTFRLPPRSGVTVEVLSAEYETYSGVDYAAFFGGETPADFGRIDHPTDSWYPGTLAEVSDPAIGHDFRFARLITYPVQVNTARREVRVYSNIEVDIRFEGTDDRAALDEWPTSISETFLPWYREFLDWDESELDDYTLHTGSVQVVMRENATLRTAMEPWFTWKKQKGWTLEFLTDEDVNTWNANDIRNELRNRYNNADTKFDYIVIIGDVNGDYPVPTGTNPVQYGYGDFADYYYQRMNDDDDYQDVIVGRISVRNETQAAAYANKVILYERDPYMEETDWYLRGTCLAAWDYAGTSAISTGEYVSGELMRLGYTDCPVHVSRFANPGPVVTDINAGVSYYHMRGGIGTGIPINSIHSLTNDFKLCVAMEPTCATGKWSYEDESITEAWIRAGTVNTPRGAIGAFGLATSVTHAALNNLLATGAAHSALTLRLPELGQMLWGGQQWIYIAFDDFENKFLNFAQQFNLMGDPLVWLWTAIPATLNVEASEIIALGTNAYSVSVTDDDGLPVENAWVTLYKSDDNEEVIAHKRTGPDGATTLYAPIRYPGEAVLTVTKQNFHPNRIDIDVVSPENRVGYVEITFQDDNFAGTSGNGNGIPEAGETVGLDITAHNFGQSGLTGITATAECDDPWVENITGEVTYTAIPAGEDVAGNGLILVEISPEAQHEWIFYLDLEFTNGQLTSTDQFPVTVNAPKFMVVSTTGSESIDPGETGTITLQLRNVGGSDAGAAEGYLNITYPMGNAVTPLANFSAMNVGESASAQFEVASHPASFSGCSNTAQLVMTTVDGQVDTVFFNLVLGTRTSTEPSGPDPYGYYAFDNTDTDYELAPVFDWVEINPNAPANDFDGINTGLDDPDDDQDTCDVYELPFPVQYYGQTFDEITISTNGWAAFGDQTAFINSPRDYPVPGPDGPYNMLAVFWDERIVTGQSGVFTYYDEVEHRYIIEWYMTDDMPTNSHHYCTFELIIYDQFGDHITWTGDNEFLFQYGDLNPTEGYGRPNPWWSTGIEAGDQNTGLQYMYFRNPYPGAVPYNQFDQGLAILFSTNVAVITGTISGNVTDGDGGDPIEDVFIRTGNNMYETTTDSLGNFSFDEVVIGDHTLFFTSECYNDTMLTLVHVAEDSVTVVDMQMLHPDIALDLGEILIEDMDPEGEVTIPLELSNPGLGVLTYEAKIAFDPPGTDSTLLSGGASGELDDYYEPWALTRTYDLDPIESRYRGLAFVDGYFWVSGSDNYDPTGPNKLYKFDSDGVLVAVFDQPVPEEDRSSIGFYGLTWDGEYLYGADQNILYKMEITEDEVLLVDTMEIPVNPARFLAYEPGRDLFWMGDVGSEIRSVNRDGELVDEFGQDINPRGLDWFENDPDGYNLYFICRVSGETITSFIKMNPENGETILMSTLDNGDDGNIPSGGDITGDWNPFAWTYVSVLDDGSQDRIELFGFQDNIPYLEILNPNGVLAPESSETIEVVLHGSNLPPNDYNLVLWFENDACDMENNWLPVTMIIPDTTNAVGDENASARPLQWEFDGAYPNPFNPSVSVRFSLKENVTVTARVFNLMGREVAVLADREMPAGTHSLVFDGSGLASGMYFLSFEAGPLREMRKLILMK